MTTPVNANDFIEQQLHDRASELEEGWGTHIIGFNGGLVGGVDDVIRDLVEILKQRDGDQDKLAVILTSTGGYIEVVHRIVDTFRYHYDDVAFVVPNYAYSAGTVLAMSGNTIHMDYYSRLGPIDPQVEIADGKRVPALGYLVQWERLLEKAENGTLTLPEVQLMLNFDQAELYQYEQARELSISLLEEWLAKYKFKNWITTETRNVPVTDQMRRERAVQIAKELNKTERWHTHGYGISMEVLKRDLNLKIHDFGTDRALSQKIRTYYSLMNDYMIKMGRYGAIHIVGTFVPFMWEV